jgi:uncharacterized membrane protein
MLLILLLSIAIVKYTGRERSEIDRIGYSVIAVVVMSLVVFIRFGRRSFSTNKI